MSENAQRYRGRGRKLAMKHVSTRISADTYEFYKTLGTKYTQVMREVLEDYARQRSYEVKDEHTGSESQSTSSENP
jgi:uncharacterized protein (DUF4415 family)